MINNPSLSLNHKINKIIHMNGKNIFFINIDPIKDCFNQSKKNSSSEVDNLNQDEIPIKRVLII